MEKEMLPYQFQDSDNKLFDKLEASTHEIVKNGRLQTLGLYLSLFKQPPHYIEIKYVKVSKAYAWFVKHYDQSIKDVQFTKRQVGDEEDNIKFDDILFFLDQDTMISFDHNFSMIEIYFRKSSHELIDEIIQGFMPFVTRHKNQEIGLITTTQNGLTLSFFDIKKTEIDIDLHYNDDFKGVHQTILECLKKRDEKGLVLLHGHPGTGKTTYIRHLVKEVNKDVIFVSPQIAENLQAPQLLSLLMDSKNSILVIEDAEKILTSREYENNATVSTILNITDGLLSDCLNIQVICTFNTKLDRIDPALYRKGRLIAKYEFKPLTQDKALALAKHLEIPLHQIDGPMNLMDLYHLGEPENELKAENSPIGFRSFAAN